jgi:acetylornithine deacetylase/succinyl-diaminopimelate desuccinylase-like protein
MNELLKSNVEWGIKVLKDMVSIPTVNPPGEKYEDFARYSEELLKSLQLARAITMVIHPSTGC